MNFTGFCTVAGEDELNRKWDDWGTEVDVFCLLENGWNRGMICLDYIILEQEEVSFNFPFQPL